VEVSLIFMEIHQEALFLKSVYNFLTSFKNLAPAEKELKLRVFKMKIIEIPAARPIFRTERVHV